MTTTKKRARRLPKMSTAAAWEAAWQRHWRRVGLPGYELPPGEETEHLWRNADPDLQSWVQATFGNE